MGPCMSAKNKNSKEKDHSIQINNLPENEKIILQCKKCRDDIKSYIKKLERTSKSKREKAKELLKNKEKDRAKLYLKQSKFHTEQARIADNQLTMVEEQINRLESTTQMLEIQKVLEKGNDVLKKMQEEMNVEKWEKIKDDMDELKEKDKEISDYLKEYGINEVEYDDQVNSDLDKLIKEIEGGNKIDLPNVPKEKITEDNNKDDNVEKIKVQKKAIPA